MVIGTFSQNTESPTNPVRFSTYFNSSAWENRKKYLENEIERHNVFLKLGQEVIKGLNALASRGR
ncbi:hypothetical protein M9A15_03035 [Acinetobacter baumannii]|uniref:hypothetical protein n=1 Tax=Acinetobacter baumannii TaxID=470 RepID=UPI0025A57E47|nr:hypothetical protein [Acinetobacter baumannii]MDM8491324.1 hypothetical protein [Acinetobacter baumannii]